MEATSLDEVIDRAAEICGGQNALARHLGMTSGNLSAAKHGKKAIPAPKIYALAQLVGMDAGAVWKLAVDRRNELRNPFRQSAAGALAGWFLMVLAVILSGAPEPAKASIGAASQPIHNATGIYIVALKV